MERENQDLALGQIRVKAAEYRTTVLASKEIANIITGNSCLFPVELQTLLLKCI